MAKKLNKFAAFCEKKAIAGGKITENSSARPLLYDISRHWRALLNATRCQSVTAGTWTEKEEEAGEIVISALTYLRRIGCKDIEQLLNDTVDRYERKLTE